MKGNCIVWRPEAVQVTLPLSSKRSTYKTVKHSTYKTVTYKTVKRSTYKTDFYKGQVGSAGKHGMVVKGNCIVWRPETVQACLQPYLLLFFITLKPIVE